MKYLTQFKWPIALAVAGVVLSVLAVLNVIEAFDENGMSFTAPGETTLNIPEPGDYRLWHEPRTYIDGKFRTFSDELPAGIEIEVLRQPQGEPVALRGGSGTMSVEVGRTRRVAVGRLEFPSAGDYTIAIDGLDEQRAFYLGEIRFWRYFARVFVFGMLALALFGGSIAWAIYVVVRISNRSN